MTGCVLEMRTLRMPLVRAFKTSRAAETVRELLLLRWITPDSEGWSECAADPQPVYFAETLDGARGIIETALLPLLTTAKGPLTSAKLHHLLAAIPGNTLAKAALETAFLDAELRARGMSLSAYLGGVTERIPVGVSVGIPGSVTELLDWVGEYLDDGYSRVKLKIQPGWDREPVAAVRREYGYALTLQVDANQAYSTGDMLLLQSLDQFDLLLIEQPFHRDDLTAHAQLARRAATPVCLDESVGGVGDAATAIALGACGVINIKPARVGGYLSARAVHDLCRAHGIPVFCGGVLETGIGRAANLALAALPNFTLAGDISATSRYYARDITQPFELSEGMLTVPDGPGSGARIDTGALADATTDLRSVDVEVDLASPAVPL